MGADDAVLADGHFCLNFELCFVDQGRICPLTTLILRGDVRLLCSTALLVVCLTTLIALLFKRIRCFILLLQMVLVIIWSHIRRCRCSRWLQNEFLVRDQLLDQHLLVEAVNVEGL